MRILVLVSLAACGKVPAHPVDAGDDDVDASIDARSIDAPPMVVDRNCTEVKARLGTASDGVYWIDPDLDGTSYKPFQVYCQGMSTPTPAEYLELAHTSQPADQATANFSTYATGAVHASWTCDCGVVTTLYSKVRIDPTTLVVTGASTFAVFSADTQLSCLQTKSGCPGITPYASAESCVTNFDASGRANVDLGDMPFHVAGTDASMFKRNEDWNPAWGFTSAGMATVDPARKIVTIDGGGDCGGFGALTGLQLAQDL